MAHLLHVDSSALAATSVSRQIADTFRKAWGEAHPDGVVTYRDLGVHPVAPLREAGIMAAYLPEDQRTAEHEEALELRERLVQEVLDADAYLFTVPMYNWGVPGTFKLWLDQIIVNGRTLGSGDSGPLAGRPATAILAYGGGYDPGAPREGWDFVQPYLETVLGKALGLDVTFIKAQLTLAERTPAMAELIPLAKEQQDQAHTAAAAHARVVAAGFAA